MKLVVDANILFAAYKELLVEKSHSSSEEFDIIVSILSERIKVVPGDELLEFFAKAESISPDPDDVLYFALALKSNCAIWSNDKKLKEQSEVRVFSAEELLKIV